jgi:hypothetical protein
MVAVKLPDGTLLYNLPHRDDNSPPPKTLP